jgi:hypothetical protein
MFIETVPNRTSPPAVLLRESYRDQHGHAQKRTLANLSKLPGEVVEGLKTLLKGGTVIGTGPDEMRIARSLPHGHVAAVLGTLRKIALDRLILSTARDTTSHRYCDLVVAMHAPLRGAAAIGMAVGAVINNRKVGKHFIIEIGDSHLTVQRRAAQIEQETRLDGVSVIRTSVPAKQLDTKDAVQAYKDLSRVERAFRSLKSIDLEIRPIRHWTADRVRSHVFLCMLAYHVEWHLRDALAPLLFHDTELATARAQRSSPVASTEPSDAAKAKKATKRSANGHRVMGFADLIDHLGTLTRNTMRLSLRGSHRFTLHSTPTLLQEAAFSLLQLEPSRVQ